MEKSPLISIIIPVYRAEKWMDACMDSIVNQQWQHLEIILVNDGSPDGSGKLCDQWAARDSRIRVIHKENGGPSTARNAGLDIARGSYVLFVDSDDVLDIRICTKLYECLCASGAEIACCEIAHLFDDEPRAFTCENEMQVYTPEQVISMMWYQHGFIPSGCAKLYKREIFDTLRFRPGLIFEDADLMHQIYWKAEKIAYTPSKMYGYIHRTGSESITTRPFSMRDMDILTVADGVLEFARKAPQLMAAAQAYVTTVAMRIVLNAPKKPQYDQGIRRAKKLLKQYGKQVLKDKNLRKKNRYALMLYYYCRPMMGVAYKFINRWK